MQEYQPDSILKFLGVNDLEPFYFARVDMPFRVNIGKECVEAQLLGEWSPVKNVEVVLQIFFHKERIRRGERKFSEAEKDVLRYLFDQYNLSDNAVLERNESGLLEAKDNGESVFMLPRKIFPQIAPGEQVSILSILCPTMVADEQS